ncbi:unnamed protein product [Rhizoctonia solani]|uniref:Uncharacterized protein n=1 Tax=Rhizoctonia solani TaxID=456999 RepID=A0A8H3HJH0_9AGAM|nr:unnamed protein product [Rhizoctonia solani]
MTLSPGTYIIHDTDLDWILSYYTGTDRIGTWQINGAADQKGWYVKRYPESSMYAIQSIASKKYIPTGLDGTNLRGAEEGDAAVFHLEHQFKDFYLIKSIGTDVYLNHPNVKPNSMDSYYPSNFTKDAPKDCFWRFERISDDAGSSLKPKTDTSEPVSSLLVPQPVVDALSSQGSSNLRTDEMHFYTDMLFNMPRTPFIWTQRIAALDWARKLGASNVPTMESYNEYERRLESALRSKNNKNQNE